MEEIRTSAPEWGERLAACYKNRRDVGLIDDANLGVDPTRQSLAAMLALGVQRFVGHGAQRWIPGVASDDAPGGLGPSRIIAALVAVGLSLVGAGIVAAAFLDPEPTSKLMLIAAAGGAMILLGGASAIWILTGLRPPSIKINPDGSFEIRWT